MEKIWRLKPTLNPEFDWEPMPDGCLVYQTNSGRVITLNPAAELILSYCDGTATTREIYAEICAEIPMTETDFLAGFSHLLKETVLTES
jgi:hypothetical protein